jgi:hypothetical protein
MSAGPTVFKPQGSLFKPPTSNVVWLRRAARCAAATAAVAQTDGLSPQLPRGVNLVSIVVQLLFSTMKQLFSGNSLEKRKNESNHQGKDARAGACFCSTP